MGRIKNDAIIVTGPFEALRLAQVEALRLDLRCTSIVTHHVNGDCSMLIVPDGSKEGWEDSNHFNMQRTRWKLWLHEQSGRKLVSDEHGFEFGFYLSWVHVQYADDYGMVEDSVVESDCQKFEELPVDQQIVEAERRMLLWGERFHALEKSR